MSSVDAYDLLAPHYRKYSEKRCEYLDAVDQYIIERVPVPVSGLLDVGAGDGYRGMKIAKACNAACTVLCDSSSEMVGLCETHKPDEVWQCFAQDIPLSDRKFDLILCLWNVLGHIPTREDRIASLRRMRLSLAAGGKLFLDVNNRHNVRAYGQWKVWCRRWVDAINFQESRGDASYDWEIAGVKFPGRGHLHTPNEVESLFSEAGLKVAERISVNYANGDISTSPYHGQLVYTLVIP